MVCSRKQKMAGTPSTTNTIDSIIILTTATTLIINYIFYCYTRITVNLIFLGIIIDILMKSTIIKMKNSVLYETCCIYVFFVYSITEIKYSFEPDGS